MTKKQRLTISGCLYLAAILIAVYGAGFSWRLTLIGGLAILVWQLADEQFKAAYTPAPFRRLQFRLAIDQIGLALAAAGLYRDELAEATQSITAAMTGNGWIIFTWLEYGLFYVNTTNHFCSMLQASIDLPPFGERMSKPNFKLPDRIEMRSTPAGYELVLLTREDRYVRTGTHGKGVVLFQLPYKFFEALQDGDPYESFHRAKKLLGSVGFTYHSDAVYSEIWHYQNTYGSLRWWDV